MRSVLALLSVSGFVVGIHAGEQSASWEDQPVEMLEADVRQIEMSVDSGLVKASEFFGEQGGHRLSSIQVPVWSTVVTVEDAGWLRIEFGDVDLSSASANGRESYLRVTSLEDGYEQYLDAAALAVWGNTSAYFNGNAVRVEIMASPGTNTSDRVRIDGVQASPAVDPASICFGVDDRVLSNDPRDGRLMPVGCSGWLFSDHGSTFLTAGHCGPGAGDVMQFNVPLSSNGGGYRNPPPQDQYVLDAESIQYTTSPTLGNDWGFFGTFDNTDTGLTPLEAQGDSHVLATSTIPNDGRPIRITGYGTTSSPVSPTWNGVQKTHTGPFRGYSGNVVRYTTDTTGGNSGSVILDENNNVAIGIHTNAGCGSGGGWNNGCNLFNAGLQNALANPTGIAAPRTIQADVVAAPDFVSPTGGDVMSLVITNYHDRTIVGSPVMEVLAGDEGYSVQMDMVDEVTFTAALPPAECGSDISFYFEIEDTDGNVTQYPEGGESEALRTVALDDQVIGVTDNFQTDTGWTVSSTGVTDGAWERRTPISSTSSGGPTSDFDGSGTCFVTGGGVSEDLDGGSTTITSSVFDISSTQDATLSFAAWVNTSSTETMLVEISSNFGFAWTTLDDIGDTNEWEIKRYLLSDYGITSSFVMVRVTIEDAGADSTVEGGIDALSIATMVCETESCPGDLTGDDMVDFLDISAFLAGFTNGDPISDLNGDGEYDFIDVSALLTAFGAGCP